MYILVDISRALEMVVQNHYYAYFLTAPLAHDDRALSASAISKLPIFQK